MFAGLLILAGAASGAEIEQHQMEIERALFEICPLVLSGELYLGSKEQVESIGYRLSAPHPQRSNAETGEGPSSIVIWGPIDSGIKTDSCIVTFAAPNRKQLFESLDQAARANEYEGPPARQINSKTRTVDLMNEEAGNWRFYMMDLGSADYVNFEPLILVAIFPKTN